MADFGRYGDVYALRAPGADAPIYVVSHPDHVKRVLVTRHANYVKGIGIERVRLLLGDGLMASEDPLWRRQRTMIQPAFHRRVLAGIEELVLAANRDLLSRWTRAAQDGAAVNVTRDTSELSLDIVLRALFGDDLERIATDAGGNPFALLTQESARDLRFAARFRALRRPLRECIARRRSLGTPAVPDLLSMLMAARDRRSGAGMNENELLDEVMTLIVAGHETTASALNWTWYLLAGHRDIDHALHRALDAGDADYPRQVIEETLRLYPPGWLLTRRALEGDEIGGYDVAPGTHVFIAPYLVHRHPRFWEDPESFRPERFAAPACADRHRYAYLPFAAGPRRCIGEFLAMMEMETHLRVVAGTLRLRRTDGGPAAVAAHVNLRTRHDLFMLPQRRRSPAETAP